MLNIHHGTHSQCHWHHKIMACGSQGHIKELMILNLCIHIIWYVMILNLCIHIIWYEYFVDQSKCPYDMGIWIDQQNIPIMIIVNLIPILYKYISSDSKTRQHNNLTSMARPMWKCAPGEIYAVLFLMLSCCSQVSASVAALRAYLQKSQQDSLVTDAHPIHLQITMKKIPKVQNKIIKMWVIVLHRWLRARLQ